MPLLPLTAEELLTTTRTVRKRLDLERPVDLTLVREALTVALQAPSGSNAQGWHFVVVTDPDRRQAIGDYYGRPSSSTSPPSARRLGCTPTTQRVLRCSSAWVTASRTSGARWGRCRCT